MFSDEFLTIDIVTTKINGKCWDRELKSLLFGYVLCCLFDLFFRWIDRQKPIEIVIINISTKIISFYSNYWRLTKLLEEKSPQRIDMLKMTMRCRVDQYHRILSIFSIPDHRMPFVRRTSKKSIVLSYNSLSTIQNKNLYATLSVQIKYIVYQTIIVSHDGGYVSTNANVFFLFNNIWITH